MPESKLLLNATALQRALARVAHEIAERNEDSANVVLIGIQKGGVHLSLRLQKILAQIWNHPVPCGCLDVSMHRDDIGQQALPAIQPTDIPGDINDKVVILVDDVLFSGRTIRAAMDAIHDFGRPKAIQLGVLIDRGNRELPIKADFVGKTIATSRKERVEVRLKEDQQEDSVYLQKL